MPVSKCKKNHKTETGLKYEDRVEGILDGVYTNDKIFKNPTITQLVFAALVTTFISTRKAHEKGGLAQLPAYEAATAALRVAVLTLAEFVDGIALGDITIINLAGYDATYDTTSTSSAMGNINITGLTLTREDSFIGRLDTDSESKGDRANYIGILCEGFPLPDGVTIDADGNIYIPSSVTMHIRVNIGMTRKKKFTGLTPGLTYYAYYIYKTSKFLSGFSNEVKMICG